MNTVGPNGGGGMVTLNGLHFRNPSAPLFNGTDDASIAKCTKEQMQGAGGACTNVKTPRFNTLIAVFLHSDSVCKRWRSRWAASIKPRRAQVSQNVPQHAHARIWILSDVDGIRRVRWKWNTYRRQQRCQMPANSMCFSRLWRATFKKRTWKKDFLYCEKLHSRASTGLRHRPF